MFFDVENYEKECKKIRTENAELLELYENDLDGLSEKTIQRHLRNMWSTPGSIKSTATSIKKFYKCMLDHKKIEKDQYQLLCETIKENMGQRQFGCELYNDPGSANPFMFF